MYSIQRKLLQRLSAACPLCGLAARGGDVCAGCTSDLAEYVDACARCAACLEALLPPSASAAPSNLSKTAAKAAPAALAAPADAADAGDGSNKASATLCWRCQRHPPAYSSLVAAIGYTYPGAMLIKRFKDGARLAYAGLFARLLWGRLQARAVGDSNHAQLSALVPIPSSQSALRRRGFNPAGELARELARISGYPLQHNWLRRTRETSTQKTLDARARRNSVQGLYVCASALPRVWIGVVDDVVTTGSTMDTAARALLSAGASGVIGLAAAHTPRTWQNDTYD